MDGWMDINIDQSNTYCIFNEALCASSVSDSFFLLNEAVLNLINFFHLQKPIITQVGCRQRGSRNADTNLFNCNFFFKLHNLYNELVALLVGLISGIRLLSLSKNLIFRIVFN